MVRTELLTPAFEFLEIPKQKWAGIIEATVSASVEELAYMNRVRFSTCSPNSIFDNDDPKSSYAVHENLLSVGRKRKIPKDRGTSGPDRSDGNESMAIKDCSMVPPITEIDARPLPLCDASTTGMLCSWENPLYFCPNLCAYVCLHPLYFCPNLCAYVCLYVSVSVCVSVYQ